LSDSDAGTYTESLSLKDGGAKLGAGLYLVKLKTDFGSRTVRVMAID
jgi:hypothetical protein